jgi:hypothetical protein
MFDLLPERAHFQLLAGSSYATALSKLDMLVCIGRLAAVPPPSISGLLI